MQEIGELELEWQQSLPRKIRQGLSLVDEGLVLGATRLLPKLDTGLAECQEPRLVALLSVAYGRPVEASVLDTVRRAAKHARAGNAAMAATHIALARLPRLSDPGDDARRLFIADGLIAKGVSPRDIFAALEFDPAPLDELEKYNPDQPRVPAGSGRTSGEWTSGSSSASSSSNGNSSAEATPLTIAGRIASETASEVTSVVEGAAGAGETAAGASVAALLAGALAFLAGVTIPMPGGGVRREGPVQDHPDLRYVWNQDETDLRIVRESDGSTVLVATLRSDGRLRVGTRRIGRKLGDTVVLDQVLPLPNAPEPTASDEPRLCPKPTPDRAGWAGQRGKIDRDYEDYMKRRVNPQDPTPRGYGYAFPNPSDPIRPVIVDDCQRTTGDIYDAKRGYVWVTNGSNPIAGEVVKKLIGQAERQVDASQGRDIYWCFSEKAAAGYFEKLFQNYPKLQRINICRMYWQEGMS